jgi:hypothetical protein
MRYYNRSLYRSCKLIDRHGLVQINSIQASFKVSEISSVNFFHQIGNFSFIRMVEPTKSKPFVKERFDLRQKVAYVVTFQLRSEMMLAKERNAAC